MKLPGSGTTTDTRPTGHSAFSSYSTPNCRSVWFTPQFLKVEGVETVPRRPRQFQHRLQVAPRVTRYDPMSIWEIDMGDRCGRSESNGISIGLSILKMGYRYGIWYIDMVILDINMGYGLMIWEMTVSIRSSPISVWDILSLWLRVAYLGVVEAAPVERRLLLGQRRRLALLRPALRVHKGF